MTHHSFNLPEILKQVEQIAEPGTTRLGEVQRRLATEMVAEREMQNRLAQQNAIMDGMEANMLKELRGGNDAQPGDLTARVAAERFKKMVSIILDREIGVFDKRTADIVRGN
jgi:hypothetical protein